MLSDGESFGWVSSDDDKTETMMDEEEEVEIYLGNKVNVKLEQNSSDEGIDVYKKSVPQTRIKKDSSFLMNSTLSPIVSNSNQINKRLNETPLLKVNDKTLELFLTNNSQFSKITNSFDFTISDDEDIFLLQCPEEIDIKCLAGLNLLKDKKKFKIDNLSYECVLSTNNIKDVSLLLPCNDELRLKTVSVEGNYVIRQRSKSENQVEVCEEQEYKVPFPDNLKKRHPLFGAAYKSLIKIPTSVREKFEQPPKKLKTPKVKTETVEDDYVVESVKKKRKRSSECGEEAEPEVPRKRIKKENDKWMSELSIEKSLFETPKKKKKTSI